MILSTVYLIFRLSLLTVFTFLFVVLYEHGPENYLENLQRDAMALAKQAPHQDPPPAAKSTNSGT